MVDFPRFRTSPLRVKRREHIRLCKLGFMFVGVGLLVRNMAGKLKKCMVCGLSDGHTLIDCPFRCNFCGESVNVCDCVNSSLIGKILDSETPDKSDKDKMCKISKRRANTDERLVSYFLSNV